MKPVFSQTATLPDRFTRQMTKWRFDVFDSQDFENLENVNQSYGVLLNSRNQVLLVAGNTKYWHLPGGTVEKNESYIETLERECQEEAACELITNSIKPFFYQKTYAWNGEKWEFGTAQVRFLAKIESKENFIEDPDHGVRFNMFADTENLQDYLRWGKTTEFIKKKLEQMF